MFLPYPRCSSDHGPWPVVLAVARPDPLLDVAADRVIVGDDNAAGEAGWFLRGALALPWRAGGLAIVYRAWCAIERRDYKRALARWRDPRRLSDPPIAGSLATALPGWPGEPAQVALRADRRGLVVEVQGEGELAIAQRTGIEPEQAVALVATALHG
jgi:hypothetical protein